MVTSLQKLRSVGLKKGWNIVSSRDYVTSTQVTDVQVTFSKRVLHLVSKSVRIIYILWGSKKVTGENVKGYLTYQPWLENWHISLWGNQFSAHCHFLGLQGRHLKLSNMLVYILSLQKHITSYMNNYIRVVGDVITKVTKCGLEIGLKNSFVTWLRHQYARPWCASYVFGEIMPSSFKYVRIIYVLTGKNVKAYISDFDEKWA